MRREWQKLMPFTSWNMMSLIWWGVMVALLADKYRFKSCSAYSKTRCSFFFHGQVEDVLETTLDHVYFTILGCGCNSFKMEISRMAVEGTPSSSFSSFILFRATISLVDRS